MQSIQYRPIEPCDYEAVGEILNQAFSLSHYVSDERTLSSFKLQYVTSCLAEATYTRVAVRNGRIMGVIMGCARTDYRTLAHLPAAAAALRYSVQMWFYGRSCRTGIRDFRNLHRVYRAFSKKHAGEFDGVLTLFALDADCRGQGVGRELLNGLLAYLRTQGTQRIYLYTDTTCTYGFYDHAHFERLETQPLTLTRDGKPFEMDVLLYGYSLGNSQKGE